MIYSSSVSSVSVRWETRKGSEDKTAYTILYRLRTRLFILGQVVRIEYDYFRAISTIMLKETYHSEARAQGSGDFDSIARAVLHHLDQVVVARCEFRELEL